MKCLQRDDAQETGDERSRSCMADHLGKEKLK
jgi:hypothetical protein